MRQTVIPSGSHGYLTTRHGLAHRSPVYPSDWPGQRRNRNLCLDNTVGGELCVSQSLVLAVATENLVFITVLLKTRTVLSYNITNKTQFEWPSRPGLARPAGTREEGEVGRNGRDRSTWRTGEHERAETADELASDEADAGVDEEADQEVQVGLG